MKMLRSLIIAGLVCAVSVTHTMEQPAWSKVLQDRRALDEQNMGEFIARVNNPSNSWRSIANELAQEFQSLRDRLAALKRFSADMQDRESIVFLEENKAFGLPGLRRKLLYLNSKKGKNLSVEDVVFKEQLSGPANLNINEF